jgi:hypothetical protein
MKTLRMKRIAENLYQTDPPVVLEEKEKTRRLFLGELAHSEKGEWCVRGTIVVEKKGSDGWNQLESLKLSTLKASEKAKLELRSEHVADCTQD